MAISLSKFECLRVLPTITKQIGEENCVRFVAHLPEVFKSIIQEVSKEPQTSARSNLDKVMKLFEVAQYLLAQFGLKAKDSIQTLLFHDLDNFNASTLLIQLIKTIIIKRDQTVIDLTQQGKAPSKPEVNIMDKFVKTGKVF